MATWSELSAALNGIYGSGAEEFSGPWNAMTPWGISISAQSWTELLTARDFVSRQSDGRSWVQVLGELDEVLKANPEKFFINSQSGPDGYSASYQNWDSFIRIYNFVKARAREEDDSGVSSHRPIGLRLLRRRRC